MKLSCILCIPPALLVCALLAGCESTNFSAATDYPHGAAVVPVAVANFSHDAAALPEKGTASDADLPKAAIRLAQQVEKLPPPVETPYSSLDFPPPPPPDLPGEAKLPIDLGGALAAASGQNPRIAFAQAQIDEAVARQRAAGVLWLPNLQYGISYNKHEGTIQETSGAIDTNLDRNALNAGLGTGSVGSGALRVPGVWANFRLSDAVFLPRILKSEASARQAAFGATLNNTLRDTAVAYLDLLEAWQTRAITLETLANARTLANLTNEFYKSGLGNKPDVERAKTELALRRGEAERANEAIRVAAARLAEVLSVRQGLFLEPQEATVVAIKLVPLEAPLPELVTTALYNRPELAESRFLVKAAIEALRREKFAPFLPSVALGISESGFGGAPGDNVDNFHGRFDLDGIVYWELRNLGLGEAAARSQMAARVRQARFHDLQVMDQVTREVAEDYAHVQTRQRQIDIARAGILAAEESFKLNLGRIKGGAGLPLEVLQSIQALDQARRDYLRALTEFDRAQFRLYRDLGWPIKN